MRELSAKLEVISSRLSGRKKWSLPLALAAVTAGAAFFLLNRAPNETTAPPKSVAVLPFEDQSEDKANAYFASGIHDDLLVNLAKIADLKVISRNSVLPYKEGARNRREIGKALGGRTALKATSAASAKSRADQRAIN